MQQKETTTLITGTFLAATNAPGVTDCSPFSEIERSVEMQLEDGTTKTFNVSGEAACIGKELFCYDVLQSSARKENIGKQAYLKISSTGKVTKFRFTPNGAIT